MVFFILMLVLFRTFLKRGWILMMLPENIFIFFKIAGSGFLMIDHQVA